MPEAYEYTEEDTKTQKTENKKEVDTEETSGEEETSNKGNYYKEQAIAQGWQPEEEWEGDPDKWVDYKEFVLRGELMDRISHQTKKINAFEKDNERLKKTLKNLAVHNKKMAELEYNRALKALRAEKVSALEENDHEAAVEIDEKIADLKKDQETFTAELSEEEETSNENEQQEIQYTPEDVNALKSWVNKNKWFTSNKVMKAAADALGDDYLSNNPGDISGMLTYIDQEIRKEFPHKFKSNKPGASVTQSSGRATSKKKETRTSTYSVGDMSDEQKSVAKQFVEMGVFQSAQEYVDQLAELGELPAQQGE